MDVKEKTKRKEDYYFLKSVGICTTCRKKKAIDGYVTCAECLEKKILYNDKYFRRDDIKERERVRRKKRYDEHKAKGICLNCNKKAEYGYYCYEHYLYRKRASRELAEKRKLQRAEERERRRNVEAVERRTGEA